MKHKTRKKRIVRRKRRVMRRKIPLRTARAMVRAGLPLRRSELRGNPRPFYNTPGLVYLGDRTTVKLSPKELLYKLEDDFAIYRQDANIGYYNMDSKVVMDFERKIAMARKLVKNSPLRRSELRRNPFDLPSRNDLLRLKRADARGYAFTKKFSSKQPQALDMLINKLSMLKGNPDEMLVTFLIRKRAKYPRDYIVILKHKQYVDGVRVYSARQRAEGAIGQFATILGAKTKRVGQSDFVFTTYGVRFPEERKKSSPGKLFGNPAKRDFYGDVYIGKKKVDTVFVRSIPEGSKRERELDVMDELLSMPNSYKLAWVKKPNGLYDVRKGFRIRET